MTESLRGKLIVLMINPTLTIDQKIDHILALFVEAVEGMEREEVDHLFRYDACFNCYAEMFEGFQAAIVRLLEGEGINAAGDTTAPPA